MNYEIRQIHITLAMSKITSADQPHTNQLTTKVHFVPKIFYNSNM